MREVEKVTEESGKFWRDLFPHTISGFLILALLNAYGFLKNSPELIGNIGITGGYILALVCCYYLSKYALAIARDVISLVSTIKTTPEET